MKRRLYRIKETKIIGGVAAGLAEYFDTDPVLIRVAIVVLVFMHGIGVLMYLILWIVMPVKPLESGTFPQADPFASAPGPAYTDAPSETRSSRGRYTIGGIILIALGLLFLADNFFPRFNFDDYWPALLIILGAGILWNVISKRQNHEVIQ